jgi:hypothetical protein
MTAQLDERLARIADDTAIDFGNVLKRQGLFTATGNGAFDSKSQYLLRAVNDCCKRLQWPAYLIVTTNVLGTIKTFTMKCATIA